MIYLDSAATTFHKPPAVYRAVETAMRTCASPGRGGYAAAQAAERTVYRCRALAAELFDCPPESVCFTSCATEGLNIAIRTLGAQRGHAASARDRGRDRAGPRAAVLLRRLGGGLCRGRYKGNRLRDLHPGFERLRGRPADRPDRGALRRAGHPADRGRLAGRGTSAGASARLEGCLRRHAGA